MTNLHLSAYEDGTDSVPKCRHIKFRHRGITQMKAYNISNLERITSILCGDQYAILTNNRPVFLRLRNISEEFCRKNKNTFGLGYPLIQGVPVAKGPKLLSIKIIPEFGETHSSVLGCERRPVSALIMSRSCFASFPVWVYKFSIHYLNNIIFYRQ